MHQLYLHNDILFFYLNENNAYLKSYQTETNILTKQENLNQKSVVSQD